MPKDDRTKLLESDMCRRQEALSNLTVHHWEGSLESLSLEDLPIKTSSKIPILSDTCASDFGGAERRCILVAEVSEVHTREL